MVAAAGANHLTEKMRWSGVKGAVRVAVLVQLDIARHRAAGRGGPDRGWGLEAVADSAFAGAAALVVGAHDGAGLGEDGAEIPAGRRADEVVAVFGGKEEVEEFALVEVRGKGGESGV